jgi:NAD(P)-dependent dehydrogenase (short-subunit alcohol dehydrogenase family)
MSDTLTNGRRMTVTLVTGANKGIGFETVRQLVELNHTVYLGARDVERGEKAAAEVGARFVQLDVTDDASVNQAIATIEAAEGRLDLLVNNAGILGAGPIDGPTAQQVFDINAVGVVRVTAAALPLLRKSSSPAVITVSSSLGSFWAVTNPERFESTVPALALYSASKAAATMLRLRYAQANPDIKFNAVEPGPAATDMTAAFGVGGAPADSAKVVVGVATLGAEMPSGTLQDVDGELAW